MNKFFNWMRYKKYILLVSILFFPTCEKEEFKEFHNQNKQFITNYASTNEKENFAELFAHYVLMKNNEDKYFSNFQKELSKIIEKYKK